MLNLKFFQKLEKFISYTMKLGGQRPQLSSLRSPNSRNKFAFALGERKLLATLKFLYVKLGG
jgi:hypothetical protein